MKSICLPLLVSVCLWIHTGTVQAAAAPTTLAGNLKAWVSSFGKDFKKVKSKDAYFTAPAFAERALDSLSATGLQTSSTVFPTLSAELQTALTKLRNDLIDLREKQDDVDDLIGDLVRDLRDASRTATPPSIAAVQTLVTLVYASVADGEVMDKERDQLTDATAAVVATSGLDPDLIADINADVAAIKASSGVTKTVLEVIKTDLATIGTIIKGMK